MRPREAQADGGIGVGGSDDDRNNRRRMQQSIGTALTLAGNVTFAEFPAPQPWKVAADFLGLVRQDDDELKAKLIETGVPGLVGLDSIEVKGVGQEVVIDVGLADDGDAGAGATAAPVPAPAPTKAPTADLVVTAAPVPAPATKPTAATPTAEAPTAKPADKPKRDDSDGDKGKDKDKGGSQDGDGDGTGNKEPTVPSPTPSPTEDEATSNGLTDDRGATIGSNAGGQPADPAASAAANSDSNPPSSPSNTTNVIVITLAVLTGLAVAVVASLLFVRRRRRQKQLRDGKWTVGQAQQREVDRHETVESPTFGASSAGGSGVGGSGGKAIGGGAKPAGAGAAGVGRGGGGEASLNGMGGSSSSSSNRTAPSPASSSTFSPASGSGSALSAESGSAGPTAVAASAAAADAAVATATRGPSLGRLGTAPPQPSGAGTPPRMGVPLAALGVRKGGTPRPTKARDDFEEEEEEVKESGSDNNVAAESITSLPAARTLSVTSVTSSRGAIYAAGSYRSHSCNSFRSNSSGGTEALAEATGVDTTSPEAILADLNTGGAGGGGGGGGSGRKAGAAASAALVGAGGAVANLFRRSSPDRKSSKQEEERHDFGVMIRATSLGSGIAAAAVDTTEHGTPVKMNGTRPPKPTHGNGGGGAASASVSPSKFSAEDFHKDWDRHLPYEWDPANGNNTAPPPQSHHGQSAGAFPSMNAQHHPSRAPSVATGGDTSSYQTSNAGGEGGAPEDHSYLHPLDWSNRGSDTEMDGTTDNGSVGNSTLSEHQSHMNMERGGRLGRVAIVQSGNEQDPIGYPAMPASLLDRAGGGDGGGAANSPMLSPVYSRSNGRVPGSGLLSPQSAVPSHDPTSPSSQSGLTTDRSDGEQSTGEDGANQFINDLLWLEKKIADVRSSAANGAGGENEGSVGGGSGGRYTYAHSPDGGVGGDHLLSPASSQHNNSNPYGRFGGKQKMRSIVCRDTYAPPGKLHIVIHTTDDGPAVHSIREGSALEGHLFTGDLIVAVDDADTRSSTAEEVIKMLGSRVDRERKITVLHFEDED